MESKSAARLPRRRALAAVVLGIVAILAIYVCPWRLCIFARLCVLGHDTTRVGRDSETVVISESPRLIADYHPASGDRPLFLLLHGSDSRGREAALCRLLATRLQADGFGVLLVDLRGFGASEDPALPLSEDFRFEDDVALAADYAVRNDLARPGNIVYLGHSLGAGVALRAGRTEPRPSAIVAVGAPRTQVRYTRLGDGWRDRFAADRLRGMQVPIDEASVEVMGRYLLEMDPTRQLAQDDLPPVLLIFGEFEQQDDFALSPEVIPAENGSPHRVYVVPRAPHSYYIYDGPFGLVSYHPKLLDSLVTAAEEWAVEHAGRRPPEALRR